jgi:hypothetical protein
MSKSFYDKLITSKSKKNKVINNIFKVPIKDKGVNMPHFYQATDSNQIQQADLLFLPTDDGYKYALVVVDDFSRKCDAVALKTKTSEEVLKAFKEIYARNILKLPNKMEVDSGSEFKSNVAKYFKDNKVWLRVADPGRHRQQALVEIRNQILGKAITKRQVGEEILTGTTSREWVEDLPHIVAAMNRAAKPIDHKNLPDTPVCQGDTCNLLTIGDKVRIALDNPIAATADEHRLHGKFRSGDIRWGLKPTTITNVILKPSFPPLYILAGKKPAYTKNQLQLVQSNEVFPNPKKFIKSKPVEKTLIKEKPLVKEIPASPLKKSKPPTPIKPPVLSKSGRTIKLPSKFKD